MTLTTPYQASFYVGDGETKAFPFVFEEVSDNFVKVIVSHIDGTTSIPTYTVDLDLKQVVFGDETPAPTADDIVCIYRETPTIQDTPFKTLEGYNAKALENILSKIVAMIQEIKSNYFSTQVLQGDPWQLDLLKSADDGATVNIDYVAKKLVKGLYFQITNGNLQVSADGSSYITMPKSSDIAEFKQTAITLPDLSVVYKLQYRIGNEWFDAAESTAEATAEDAKDIAEDAKDIAQDASDAVSAHITDTNNPHSVTVAQIGALPDTTKYGATLSLTIDSTTYVVTAQLKDQDGNNLGTAQTIDLPLESVVVSGSYDSVTKEVVLTLQGGSTIRFSVADLVSGLQTEITALNMLDADLVDDTTSTHKFVTTTEKSTWNGKQDTISDLATIRSNAQAGKAASDTIATYGDIVTHDVTEFATATQGAKADTALQSGDNVSELVNDAGYLVMGDLTNFVTKNTAQTISGLKTFSADITLSGTTSIKNTTNGVSYTMLYRDASGIHVGTSTQALLFAGSTARPKFNNNDIAMLSDIPTTVSQLTNDTGFITNAVNDLQNYTLTSDLATVATSGSYNDLSNKPTIPTTLAGLTGDVSISSPSGGEHLVYDAVASKWKNTPSAATVSWGGVTGTLSDQTDLQSALNGKADVATTLSGYGITDGAKTDLSNITSAGANIGNWSSNITNCITEIPQDIIAEIDMINTSATLKAGSKVYVPNGFEQDGTTPKFDEKPIESDITKSSFSVSNIMVFVKPNDDLDILLRGYCYSGTTAPTSFQGGLYAVWYDTTNNIIKRTADGGSTWTTGYSLPVFIGNSDNTHKVFNGFGYIGSTVFALPGVKGLIPNGRNSDGTLNTTPFTTASVITRTFTDTQETDLAFDGLVIGQNTNYYLGNDNYLYDSINSIQAKIVIGRCKRTSGVISNFNTKQTFHALDYSDSEYIANCAMPSDMYVDLTLGASETNYTAPAVGWFSFDARIAGAGYGVGLVYANNGHFESRSNCSATNQVCGVVIPVNKGQIITISYGPLATTNPRANLRFYYAKGAQ